MLELRPDLVDALWAKGILWWKLRAVQQLMYNAEKASSAPTWVENCSRQLGKSFTNGVRASETAIQNSDALIPFAAPTHKMLRAINIPIFKEISRDAPPDIKPIWKPGSGFFYFPSTKSEIPLAGVNNGHADDLRGRKSDRFFVDEAGFVDELEYLVESVATPQLLTTNGRLNMSSSPSRTPAHDFAMYVQRAMKAKAYAEYDILQSGYTPELIANFRQRANGPEWKPGMPDSSNWLREYMCQFVVDESYAIIPEWNKKYETEVERGPLFVFYHLYEGMDMGAVDKTVVLFAWYDFLNARLVVEDEYVIFGPSMTTERLAAAVKEREHRLWPSATPGKARNVYRRVADNNNPIMLLDLSAMHDLPFMPTQKSGRTERQTIIEAMVNELRINVQAGKVLVHPRCTELIGCLRYGIWEENRKTFARSREYGHFDALAALIYLNRNIDRVTNPIPHDYNLNPSEQFITPDSSKKPEHETIKQAFGLKRK